MNSHHYNKKVHPSHRRPIICLQTKKENSLKKTNTHEEVFYLANKWIEQARQAVQNLTNQQTHASQEDRQKELELVQHSIQAAYEQSTPEEEEQVRELENQLNKHL
ncbi:DUF3813 family protein [Allobacillus salarius]|uniref:DUF3813 family protein n=1 Tax=Allobacillus salarius TaxID=1955272 RepID=A0A556PMA7_9BACI|nr:DUF3813 family protein [Allobacillus salarius]